MSRSKVLLTISIALAFASGIGVRVAISKKFNPAVMQAQAIRGDGLHGPRDMMWIAGGEFMMGSVDRFARPNEQPIHLVRIHGFWIDRTPVTNAQFAAFVTATGYVTTAERAPQWETLKAQLPVDTPQPAADLLVPGAMVFVGTDRPVDLSD